MQPPWDDAEINGTASKSPNSHLLSVTSADHLQIMTPVRHAGLIQDPFRKHMKIFVKSTFQKTNKKHCWSYLSIYLAQVEQWHFNDSTAVGTNDI